MLAVVAGVGGFAALNWQSLVFASAVAASDKRPDLLRDAEWEKPGTAIVFRQRFRRGSFESSLSEWLEANHFDIDRRARRATLRVGGVPCAENVVVSWASSNGKISASKAVISEAGCL